MIGINLALQSGGRLELSQAMFRVGREHWPSVSRFSWQILQRPGTCHEGGAGDGVTSTDIQD